MDKAAWRTLWLLLLGVTLLSQVSRVESAFGEDGEGSGDDYGQEDDDDDMYGGGSPVMPTRVVPSLRSPLPTGGGGEGSDQDKTDVPRIDSVYVSLFQSHFQHISFV